MLKLILMMALGANSFDNFRIVEQGGSGLATTASGLSCFHDNDNSVSLCVYTSDTLGHGISPPNATVDANGKTLTIHAENLPANATAARTASNLVLAGGLDSKTVVFTPAGANPDTGGLCTAVDTVTVTINGTANVFTYTVYCAAGCATRNAAATALAGAIEAVAEVGATVGTITGGVADAVLITADQPGTVGVLLAQNDATCTAISNGTNGQVVLGFFPAYYPQLVGRGDLATGFNLGRDVGYIDIFVSTASIGYFSAAGLILSSTGSGLQSTFVGSGEAALTVATMALSQVTNSTRLRAANLKASWTNAQVVALGAGTTGDISVVTLPAKTAVRNIYVVIDTACTIADTLTVAVGRTGAGYIDYIVASDAEAPANTVYGDATIERGTNLTGYDLPSYTAATTIYAHFITGGAALNSVTTCTGHVILATEIMP